MVGNKAASVAMATALVGILAGCGTSSAPSAAASRHVSISFMEAMSSGSLKTGLVTLVHRFEKTHKNITVQLIPEASYSVLEAKIEAAVAGDKAPTIAQVENDWAAGYAHSGVIVPLTKYVNGSSGLTAAQKADIWKGVWNDQFIKGTMYMFPFNESDYVMYYNATWLKKDHLLVPTTWTQFASDLKAVTSPSKDTWGMSMDPGSATEGAENGTYFYTSIMQSYGGTLASKSGKPTLDTKAAQEALQYLVNLWKAGYVKFGTDYPGQTAMGSEHSLFDMSTVASYYYNEVADAGKFTMAVAAFPKGPAGSGNSLAGTNIAIFSSASKAQRQAAWTFMKWLAAPRQTAYWAETTGYLPVTKAALPDMKKYVATHPYVKIAADSLQYATATPPEAGFDEAMGAVANAIQEATVGHESVALALKNAQSQAVSDIAAARS
jgi:multiple sugar transport system substrate-binding protein